MLKKIGDTFYIDHRGQKFIRIVDTFYPIYPTSFNKNQVFIINHEKQKRDVYQPPTEVNACDLSGGG